ADPQPARREEEPGHRRLRGRRQHTGAVRGACEARYREVPAHDPRIENAAARLIERKTAMSVTLGYLLPTRESIMEGRPEGERMLELGERAEGLAYDGVWV